MIWFFYILLIAFLAAYVYFSLKVATRLLTKILNLEKQVSDLFDNDEWCEKQIEEISGTAESALSDSQGNYKSYMRSVANIWQKIDNLSNDINRAKMRIGKLEQGNISDPFVSTAIIDDSAYAVDPVARTEEASSQSNS